MSIPPKIKAWVVDVGERVASAFGEGVVSAVLGGALAKGFNADTEHVLLFAGLSAAAAVLKGALASIVNGTVSPASFAPAQQPGQAQQDAPPPADGASSVFARVAQLPPPSGRKGGALPSPRDDRDWQAKLPKLSTIPASCDFGAGIPWAMLLNDRIGDCYPAALLHALQVISGGKFTPTDADALAVYEQVTGYDPHRTQPDGSNPTDNGTAGRPLFDWARAHGLITSYAAVPANRTAVRQAIAAHKAVLCEWALPVGAEREGAKWTMPRSNRAAGSWGYHATVEVGYTSRHNDNVTWGEEGTVTPPFEDAYLQAAWVVTAPAVIPPIRH